MDSSATEENAFEFEEATKDTVSHDSDIDDESQTYDASVLFPNMNKPMRMSNKMEWKI